MLFFAKCYANQFTYIENYKFLAKIKYHISKLSSIEKSHSQRIYNIEIFILSWLPFFQNANLGDVLLNSKSL